MRRGTDSGIDISNNFHRCRIEVVINYLADPYYSTDIIAIYVTVYVENRMH